MELKFDPGFLAIGDYLSQIDSQYRVNLTLIFSELDTDMEATESHDKKVFQISVRGDHLSVKLVAGK